jgi:hypothetical protein
MMLDKRMRKRFFGLALSALLLALSFPVEAQQPKKIWRIGYLSTVNPVTESARAEGIRLALHEHGYIEGQDIAIE